MSYRGRSEGCYGRTRHFQRGHANRNSKVSKAEQEQRWKEINNYEFNHPSSSHSRLRANLTAHKLCGNTH